MPHIHEKIDFVVVAFIVHSGKVLMVHHKELKMWLPVGGHIEPDEDPEEALFREINEEAGLQPSQVEILESRPELPDGELKTVKFIPAPSYIDRHRINDVHQHVSLVYFARSNTHEVKLAEQEHHKIRWFAENELDDPTFQLTPAMKLYCREALKRIK